MVDGGAGAVSGEVFRGLAGCLATGVSVVVALVEGAPVATTAGSVVAASWDPPLLAVFFRGDSRMAAALDRSERFTVNILGEADHGLARRFAHPDRGRGWATLTDVGLKSRGPSPPRLDAAIAWADCRVSRIIPIGDHACYVGDVLELDRRADASPLVYHRGRLRALGPTVAPVSWLEADGIDLAAAW